jgi:hypothetical protein
MAVASDFSRHGMPPIRDEPTESVEVDLNAVERLVTRTLAASGRTD